MTKKTPPKPAEIKLINMRGMAAEKVAYSVEEVIAQATAEGPGQALIKRKDDKEAVPAIVDIPMFVDSPDYAYQPKTGDDINVSSSTSTLIDL